MLKVRITKINVNTAAGKEEGKKTVAKCSVQANDGSNNALSGLRVVPGP